MKLRSEDSLFEFIEKVFEHKEKYDISEKVAFYELVEFYSLSEQKFNEAIEKIGKKSYFEINLFKKIFLIGYPMKKFK